MRKFIQRLINRGRGWWAGLWDQTPKARGLLVIPGDSLPKAIPARDLVLARDDGEDWCVGMKCPFGCDRTLELLLVPEASPRWELTVDREGRPTLHPSVWVKDGCRSHFWVRHGQIDWCHDQR